MQDSEGAIRKAMKEAEKCMAWSVAIMLAKVLGDEEALNKYAGDLVNIRYWHIPEAERTPARLDQERQKILSEA